ncbi:MAG TPA: BON domain-containing protein [Pyrinomonadaceae bacterium]|nr:BON domain-containing protein [Pyrinomonadaceae bacterium]
MSNRYDDRDYDRGERSGRRRESEYGRSSNRTQERYRWGREDDDDDDRENRYAGESRWGGQYGRSRSGGGEYGGGRESRGYGGGGQESGGRSEYDRGWESGGGERDRSRFGAYTGGGYMGGGSIGSGYTGGGYGYTGGGSSSGQMGGGGYGSTGGGYGGGGSQQRWGESSNRYSQRYDYPSDYPSRGMHSNQGERTFDYDRSRYGRGQEGGYEYDRDRQGGQGGEDRGWWDRASDAVASWFGDEEAERRRRMDQRREEWRGKGPKGYRRSDERIREDINDRLSEGYLDASEVEVTVVSAEVTLTGTVNNRWDKRRAEDIAESVSGVTHVENRIRVKQPGSESYGSNTMTTSGTTSTTGAGSGDTGTGNVGTTGAAGTMGTGGGAGTGTGTGATGGATSSSTAAAGGTGTRAKS